MIKQIMNKLYSDWTFQDKEEMSNFKIPGLSILEIMSGGHPSITNLQGFNLLDERRDAIKKYFGHKTIPYQTLDGKTLYRSIQNFEDLMIFFANEYLNILKDKINGEEQHIDKNIFLQGYASSSIG